MSSAKQLIEQLIEAQSLKDLEALSIKLGGYPRGNDAPDKFTTPRRYFFTFPDSASSEEFEDKLSYPWDAIVKQYQGRLRVEVYRTDSNAPK